MRIGIQLMNIQKSGFSLRKAVKPPSGFAPIPKSRHGGFHRKSPTGSGWLYWYASQHHAKKGHDWVADTAKGGGVRGVEAGHFVAVSGRSGLYVWTPDAGASDPTGKSTWVTAYDNQHDAAHGTPVRVLVRDVTAMKSVERKKTPPPPAPLPIVQNKYSDTIPRTKKKTRTATDPKPPKPGEQKPKPPMTEGVPQIPMTPVFAGSKAKIGSFLHKLENGAYPLTPIKDDHYGTSQRTSAGLGRYAVWVPKEDQAGVFKEMGPLINAVARTVAETYSIPRRASGQLHPDFEEVRGGAVLGFMMALRSYAGGGPFLSHAQRYANVYAISSAREVLSVGGATIPSRQMQMLHGLMAAVNRAQSAEGETPNVQQIANNWHIPKLQLFVGSMTSLGSRPSTDKDGRPILVDQTREEVPMGPWQLIGPDGKKRGKVQPGKIQLVESMTPLLSGNRVKDSEWMSAHEDRLMPIGAVDSDLPFSSQQLVRDEIESVFREMSPKHAAMLRATFGFDDKDIGISVSDLSDRLELTKPDASDRTKRRALEKVRDEAIVRYQVIVAKRPKAPSWRSVERWSKIPSSGGNIIDDPGPSTRDLMARFGTEERTKIYQSGVRAGFEATVGSALDKETAGRLKPEQKTKLRQWFYMHRDAERLEAFRRNTATWTPDRGEALPLQTIVPGSTSYHTGLEDDDRPAMLAVLKRGSQTR